MFGIGLSNAEWVGLAGAAFLLLRVLYGLAVVLWWYATDALRPTRVPTVTAALTGIGVGAMAVGLLSAATDWPAGGGHFAVYGFVGVVGWFLGVIFEFVVFFRLLRLSDWLMSLRVPQYRDQLQLGDTDARRGAADRLATLGLYAAPARPELIAVLRGDDSADVRFAASRALLYATPDPPEEGDTDTPGAARAALADADPRVRVFAAAILVPYKAAGPAAVLPILCAGLADPDDEVSGVATSALGVIGPDAAPAIPALREAALKFEKPNISAPNALGAIGGPEAVEALVEVLERGDNTARNLAAHALAGMGERARAALPALQKAALHTDIGVSGAARQAIKKIGGSV
jgi:hypothetical protein